MRWPFFICRLASFCKILVVNTAQPASRILPSLAISSRGKQYSIFWREWCDARAGLVTPPVLLPFVVRLSDEVSSKTAHPANGILSLLASLNGCGRICYCDAQLLLGYQYFKGMMAHQYDFRRRFSRLMRVESWSPLRFESSICTLGYDRRICLRLARKGVDSPSLTSIMACMDTVHLHHQSSIV